MFNVYSYVQLKCTTLGPIDVLSLVTSKHLLHVIHFFLLFRCNAMFPRQETNSSDAKNFFSDTTFSLHIILTYVETLHGK